MSDDWKPIKETDFYDPHAAEKDATVRIAASELGRLKAERDFERQKRNEAVELCSKMEAERDALKAEVECLKDTLSIMGDVDLLNQSRENELTKEREISAMLREALAQIADEGIDTSTDGGMRFVTEALNREAEMRGEK